MYLCMSILLIIAICFGGFLMCIRDQYVSFIMIYGFCVAIAIIIIGDGATPITTTTTIATTTTFGVMG